MKYLNLAGLTYFYQKLKTTLDTLANKSHTHSNKTVLDSITAVDSALSDTSTNPVQNQAVAKAVSNCLPLDGTAASAEKLSTARTINGTGFDGTGDISIGVQGCYVKNSNSTYADAPWHKIASVSITGNNTSRAVTLLASRVNLTSKTAAGILRIDIRSNNTAGRILTSYSRAVWLAAVKDMPTEKFYVTYTEDTASPKLTVELWMKVEYQYETWRFSILEQDNLAVPGALTGVWTLYSSTSGATSYGDVTGVISPEFAELANPLADSGWTNLASNVYYRKVGDLVEITGNYTPTSAGGGFTIGTMPSGYRPASYPAYATMATDAIATIYNVAVSTSGSVTIGGSGASAFSANVAYRVHLMYFVN